MIDKRKQTGIHRAGLSRFEIRMTFLALSEG